MENKFSLKCRSVWNWLKQKDIVWFASIATLIMLIFVFYQLYSGKELMRELKRQTTLLENQTFMSNSLTISQLGDRSMWNTPHGGEYNSYFILKTLEKETIIPRFKELISDQIKRVDDMYKSDDVRTSFVRNQRFICRQSDPPCTRGWENETNTSLNNVILHINRYLWQERAKAAYLLRHVKRKHLIDNKKKVFDALKHVLEKTEWSLIVRKTALDTYTNLTGFQPANIFDFDGALDDIEGNPDIILKTRKKSPSK